MSDIPLPFPALEAADLRAVLGDAGDSGDPGMRLRSLVDAGKAVLPVPGSGHTLDRWRTLATVAGHDLALAKLFESHADAVAVLEELGDGEDRACGRLWAVWCAEPPDRRVTLSAARGTRARLHGTKACHRAVVPGRPSGP